MKAAAIACVVATCVIGLGGAIPAAAAEQVQYEGELTSGTPVDGTVIFRNERPRKVKTLNFGAPLEPVFIDCETTGPHSANTTANDMRVNRKLKFKSRDTSRVDGRFTRKGVMKGVFSYRATVDFGSGPEECATETPEKFKLTPVPDATSL